MIEKKRALMAAKYMKQLVNKKHPTRKRLKTLFIICIAINSSNVKLISNKIIYPNGIKNQIKYIQQTVIYKAIIKYKISKLTTNKMNLTNNFIPSVIGVKIPNRNNPGPTRN